MKKLQRKLEALQNELYDLHFIASPEVYKQRRADIEYQIVLVEEAIELEKKMLPFKVIFGVACVAIVAILIVYYCKI
jgi:cytochrome c-type biogenesis protein CcmH/NrfG